MRIYSSSKARHLVVVLLSLTAACVGKKAAYSNEDLKTLLGDLRSVASEEKESILKSLSAPKDLILGEESKNSYIVRVEPEKRDSKSYQVKKANGSSEEYDFVQWYATPSRVVEQLERAKPESKIDSFGGSSENNHQDHNSRSASEYEEDASRNQHHDNHYHVDHHHGDSGAVGNPSSYTSHHNDEDGGTHHDGPTSDVFYRKLKLKKVKRNCTKSRGKKVQGWPDRSDTAVRSDSKAQLPNYNSNPNSFHQSLPAYPESRFNDVSKTPAYPDVSGNIFGFSGEHLHGIPRTHFFQYKDGEGINHYHLHNHNHIYDKYGNKINFDFNPTYRNLEQHFGKLKSILTTKELGSPYTSQQMNDNYRPPFSLENPDSAPGPGSQKRGYHYTGTHESYGRKTYKRIYPRTKTTSFSTDDGDKTIGMEMFRYGAGQYGTDEFSSHEDKGRYPNEVSLGVDKPYPNSGEIYEPVRTNPPHDSREHGFDTSGRGPYKHYNSDYSSEYGHGGRDEKYNNNYEDKAPYEPQEKAPFVPQEKAPFVPQEKAPFVPQEKAPFVPQEKAPFDPQGKGPYVPQNPYKGSVSGDYQGGYGRPLNDVPRNPVEKPTPFNPSDDKSGPTSNESDSPKEPEDMGPPSVTHSVSYSQDGDIESVNFGPDNFHLYQNLRPDPDPLTIPKNARIFEHYIRLNPMDFMHPAIARYPVNYPAVYGNGMYPLPVQKYPVPIPKYPVPLHKLMHNPLKMPMVPASAPLYPRHPAMHLDEMLRAYHARSLYYPWW